MIMRTSIFTSLLLLLLLSSILVPEAQGIRIFVKTSSLSGKLHKLHEDLVSGLRSIVETNICKGDGYLESGRHRKLVMTKSTSTSSTTTTSKNAKNDDGNNKAESNTRDGGKDENFSVKPSSVTEQTENHRPDMLDLAGMDYSPAKKKPPIHN